MLSVEEKIREIKEKLARKVRERGEAYADDVNAWHDNAAFDLVNEEILVLEARLRELNENLQGFSAKNKN